MKIFQVVPYYPPHIGGMEFIVQNISEELVSRGHEVVVFTSSRIPNGQIVNGVRVNSIKEIFRIYNTPIAPNLFFKLLESEKPDIIHSHQYPIFFSDVSSYVSLIKHIPLFLHIHVVSDVKSSLSGALSRLYYSTLGKNSFRVATQIISPSAAYKTKICKMGAQENKIKVIPNGIYLEKFLQGNIDEFRGRYNCHGSKVILSVGRLNYQKGFQYLIKAMPKILQEVPNAKLFIVGVGEQFDFLKSLTNLLGVHESVIFTGYLSSKELSNAYSAADLFVLPSIFESFGMALVEAQAAGKPVIGSRTGGIPEAMIDGESGFLVEPGNVAELKDTIVRLLLDERLSCKMGYNGRLFVKQQFSIKHVVDCLMVEYLRAI